MRKVTDASAALPSMSDDIVLLRRRNDSDVVPPDRQRVFFDESVPEERLGEIRSAQIWAPHDDRIERLPEIVRGMENLVSLTVSGGSSGPSLITEMHADDLPNSLQELRILQEYGRTLVWPGAVLPKLTTLFVNDVLRFDASAFPALRSLSMKVDRSQTNLKEALRLPLDELNVLNLTLDESVFDLLVTSPLRRLGLLSGNKIASLEGIGKLPTLEALRVKNLRALHDISALRDLPRLTRLDIQYCRRIGNIDVLNDLTSLERLTLVGCGAIGLDRVQATIARIPVTTIGATS